ncbi:type II toxin-antitoxin system RelE/ParE family toxin [Flagellimonas sp.]|uniref:type II toxin-antitoxin system RelE/ParE family toxin n=1 Tax=Flagellimonas sp. TaxID=2058762 RepID=UPI003B5AD177
MTKYKLSPEAKDDLIRIYNYGLIQFGEAQAEKYIVELLDAFKRLTENPEHFPSVEEIAPGYRRCVHKSDSIYFKVIANTVEVMAIVGRQDFG